MNNREGIKPIEILLVEDNPADVRLIMEVLKEFSVNNELHLVRDGVDAMDFLHKEGEYADAPRPDLILLDLNLPRKDGREVLVDVKEDDKLKSIPVVIFTTSSTHEDIDKAYKNYASCYITKPVDFEQLMKVIQTIENFWLTIVKLPEGK